MLLQLLTNIDVRILLSLPILPTSLSSVNILILCRSSSLANLTPRNLTLLVNWAKKFPKPSSLRIRKTQAERILVEATVHQTHMGRIIIPLTQPARPLAIKAVKVFPRTSLTITTSLFGGPPPKENLTWGGGGGPKTHSRTEIQQAARASSQQEICTRKTFHLLIHLPLFPLFTST